MRKVCERTPELMEDSDLKGGSCLVCLEMKKVVVSCRRGTHFGEEA